ncbi:hypothetical protein M413DRAFT_443045 [Hebeloma cylindrosporum]|uniref:Uncharacterized protein n=1 Tax=Hebeloma cylindrosporum TaxID=76867 RepID=A0A0C2Y293_HEBCY|nr:hypothetical protein M413DRAFT_443045 [Hebeloma cylindrosporum h7]
MTNASVISPTYYIGAERMAHYSPGGHHLVLIGDIFNERYQVINKLGSSAFSLV